MITDEIEGKDLQAFVHDNECIHAWIHRAIDVEVSDWIQRKSYCVKKIKIKTENGTHFIDVFKSL